MYDYFKLWIEDPEQIKKLLSLPNLEFKQRFNTKTGLVDEYPQEASARPFTVTVKSSTRVEITGSIHKYWSKGANDNDFHFAEAVKAIHSFCKEFDLSPELAKVCNLEYGVNVYPEENASDLINLILCVKNRKPMTPYTTRPDRYFTEYPVGETFIKVYDKGRQYGNKRNTLRFEIKAKKNRCLCHANVSTLADLLKPETMIALGREINNVFKGVVFTDDTIDPDKLSSSDRNNFLRMKDANEWANVLGQKTSTHRNRENRFRQIIEQYGKRKIYSTMQAMIEAKVNELSPCQMLEIPSKYNRKTNKPKKDSVVKSIAEPAARVLSINVQTRAKAS